MEETVNNWEIATENAERMLKEYRHRCRLGPEEYPPHWVGFDIYREFMQELLDAKDREREQAVKEAVKATVEKCAVVAVKEFSKRNYTCGSDVSHAIRALIAPPVPVWQHKPGCPTPFKWSEQFQNYALPSKVDGVTECACRNWMYCPSCGSAKPKVTP
jgi:hypothetical protein